MSATWDRLVNDAVSAIDSGRMADFEVPDDIACQFPGTPEQCRLFVLAAGFQKWAESMTP